MPKNDLNQNLDLSKYQDSGGISFKKLNLGLWIVSHKRQFILGVIGVLIGISAIFYGYSIYNYIDYFFIGGKKERADLEALVNSPIIGEAQRIQNTAKELEILPAYVFFNSGNYDFLGQVKNPNNNFFVNINYCFTDGTTELACDSTFLFPSEVKYVTSLANNLQHKPAKVNLVIKNKAWQRVNLHDYPDWNNFSTTHLNFLVENASFKLSEESSSSDKIGLDLLSFDITNNTAYNYWEVPLNIILVSGNIPVAVNHYVLTEFISGEKRSARLSWPDSIPRPDQITVLPDLNIIDDEIYMKYE